jgi:uncharacterized protein (TIGR02453 family)
MPPMRRGHFDSELFKFLRDLAAHNQRDWFLANKARYEEHVKDKVASFVDDAQARIGRISREFEGKVFRINRDTRFSKDKSPYKTNVGLHFAHRGSEGSAPGFYLHLEPGGSFGGFGVWHPEPDALARVRDAIVAKPAEWKRVTRGRTLEGERLKRPPQGYDAEHPLVEDLKRKDFITSQKLTDQQVCAADFLERFVALCRGEAPFVGFLTRAMGLPF